MLPVVLRQVSRTYHLDDVEVPALRAVTLDVRPQRFTVISGPSGSGKTTLLNLVGCIDRPDSGEILVAGEPVQQLDDDALSDLRARRIGFVFQSFNLLKRTTALRQVELPLIYGGVGGRTKRAKGALEAVGLGQRLDHLPSELSGGQQQRVAIARAIVTEPAIILADEPTGNLDSRSGTEVMQIFQTMNRERGITTVFVTHDPWIARHTNRVIMVRDGKIVADRAVASPLVAGDAERPSEAEELEGIFRDAYYGGKKEEYT
ncbi:MAG: ABC transporter ATP-binding protein [Burkholderiaceae bacterium]|nr:ABC transporter ATP-binding protein [Burkholderiaceae bacterium]